MFKRIVLCLGLSLIPLIAQDNISQADLRNLPKAKQLEIQATIEEAKKASGIQPTSPEQVSKWIGLGKDVAELIPVFAEKTGIAADKVLNSFSGKVLLTIVLVHFFWTKLVALFLVFVGLPLWWKFFKRVFLLAKSEQIVHPNKILAWFGLTRTLNTYRSISEANEDRSDTTTAWLFISFFMLAAIIVSSIVAFFI